jgi:hypothetical protein
MIQSKLERGLAGLQAGMLGGIALLVVMTVVSLLDHRHWWSYPNTIAAVFYGARSIGAGLGWHTVSGAALQLVIAGVAGLLFGALFGSASAGRRNLAFGLAWGVLVYFFSGQFYRVFKPVVLVYLPGSAAMVAHLVYGVSLGWTGRLGMAGPDDEFGRGLANSDPGNPPLGAGPRSPAPATDVTLIAPGTTPAQDDGNAQEGQKDGLQT